MNDHPDHSQNDQKWIFKDLHNVHAHSDDGYQNIDEQATNLTGSGTFQTP